MTRVACTLLFLAAACGPGAVEGPPPPPPPPRGAASTTVDAGPPAAADALGPRPTVGEPAPFVPPVPASWKHSSGVTIWLLERHSLPIVSFQLVIPGGAKWEKKHGVAWATANMLDEGAGTRGALEISRDLDRLGATLQTGAVSDYSFAQLSVLKKNLKDASAIFSDVVAKPTFSTTEWARVQNLWVNDLKQRASDPAAVAKVVLQRKVFGEGDAYSIPVNGLASTAPKVTLADLKAHYADEWIPQHATCVVVGDVTRADLDPILDATFGPWKNPAKSGGGGRSAHRLKGRRVYLVDRPDAPQSVIAVGRMGVSGKSPQAPPLVRINSILGGSFTSRLNQDLREEHGWSYGASSRFSWNESQGIFSAQASVITEHTGEALKAMLADIEKLQKDGPTDEEVAKSRLLARADLVESFEGVESTAARLARNAGIEASADHETKAAEAAARATKSDLVSLAHEFLDLSNAVVVVVGPKAKVQPQLEAIGITQFDTTGPEGE